MINLITIRVMSLMLQQILFTLDLETNLIIWFKRPNEVLILVLLIISFLMILNLIQIMVDLLLIEIRFIFHFLYSITIVSVFTNKNEAKPHQRYFFVFRSNQKLGIFAKTVNRLDSKTISLVFPANPI